MRPAPLYLLTEMKAAVLTALNTLVLDDFRKPGPKAGEVVVRLRAAALNHRDVWIKSGQYVGLKYPSILGSDGAGYVSDVGAGVESSWVDREVIINPAFDWGHHERAQEPKFSILGLPHHGTFAEYVCVPVGQLAPKPPHLSWEEAAALPLAGLTAFRAVFTRAQLQAHEKVLITGIGAGTALFALQFAVAAGAVPFVTSSSPQKLEKAHQMGARHGTLYTTSGWAKDFGAHYGPFDVIVDSAGGPNFGDLTDLCNAGGRIVFFGATRGNPHELPMRKIFWKQLTVLGTTMGSPADFSAMTDFVTKRAIHPVISATYPLEQLAAAFDLMEAGGQFGKIVITLPQ
ncbi:MAG TPA: zinc-binding dehydrogenase [Verrucomicrobiota bacterium]|nr:zinc-binding dehydrogenase [Verrucomicrobiota bacterium]